MQKMWYVLYTRPRFEFKVHNELLALGFESYLPTQKTLKQWSDRKKWIEEPLFNSYCFVKIQSNLFRSVLQVKGVVRFIFIKEKPVVVRDHEIEVIKSLCESEMILEVCNEKYDIGQKVEINAGPLKGVAGEVVNIKGKDKLVVQIESMSTSILVTLPVSAVVA